VFLRDLAGRIPTVAALFQKLHPGERYYLTNIQALGLKPEAVRQWSDDLWLFPYYVDKGFVPFDARPGGPAATAWPGETSAGEESSSSAEAGGEPAMAGTTRTIKWLLAAGCGIGLAIAAFLAIRLRGQPRN